MKDARLDHQQLEFVFAELGQLTRSGVPLTQGLASLGPDTPGRVGRALRRIARELAAGSTLPEALASVRGVSRASLAVLESGARAGRLPDALEAVARSASFQHDLERELRLGAIYPFLLAVAGALGLSVLVPLVVPTLLDFVDRMRLEDGPATALLRWVAPRLPLLGILLVTVLLVLLILRLVKQRCWTGGWASRLMRVLPGLEGVVVASRSAHLTELLALQLEQGVPNAEAYRLAAPAAGNRSWTEALAELADGVAAGQTEAQCLEEERRLPALLRWALAGPPAEMTRRLRSAAAQYRRRAVARSERTRIVLPAAFVVLIGSGILLTYLCLFCAPWAETMVGIATHLAG